uniref:Putative effector protein n=1 Tax=Heterodera avenae TaxID=34510 RepID=A0A2L0VDK8_HETAV|nr:putative effector protein [Heterodera avenae]
MWACYFVFAFLLLLLTLHSISGTVLLRQRRQNAKITAYDEQYAKTLAALSAGAYATSPNECIRRWLPNSNFWRVYALSNQACDVLEQTCASYTIVSEQYRQLIIVFRGTKSSEQLFLEGWQSLKPGTNFHGIGQVNSYFNEALNILWPSVEQALKDQNMANFPVTFTGHSLGGALAALAAAKCVALGLRTSNMVKLYTFGEPRVGNSAFAARFDQIVPNSFRVIFRKDIVPHLPPCSTTAKQNPGNIGGFLDEENKPCEPNSNVIAYHHGTEIWYSNEMPKLESKTAPTEKQRYYECVGNPRDEDFSCSDSVDFEIPRYKSYIWDHRHYFGHRLPVFGKLGCDPSANDEVSVPEKKVTVGGNQAALPSARGNDNEGKQSQASKFLKIAAGVVGMFG